VQAVGLLLKSVRQCAVLLIALRHLTPGLDLLLSSW